ncbi:MAG: leucine--tRNA ligase [Candidatus Riflebacteria bacterium]|nr:leucine--tRNA ligase [Candidatus Riflebacteria bacterium]
MATTEGAGKGRTGYDHDALQKKWSERWRGDGLYRTRQDPDRPKFYCLDFFPYPSGAGLSVGHLRNYVPTDVISRFMTMRGYNVLHPMGWDAFGLPAENYALKMGIHPARTTAQNVATYKRQMALVETCYDWDKEVNSSTPEYYRWTQWFFLLLFDRGLAYQAEGQQWWVEDGRCWRHTETAVTKKSLKQWYFKITDYAEPLIADLETIEWPDHIRKMQLNWIGRSEGCEVIFKGLRPEGGEVDLPIFTTRVDTIFGVTYMVLAPEHPLVGALTAPPRRAAVSAYIEESRRKSDIDRASTDKEKTGVALGSFAVNPLNGERIPIWIGDYVLASYGTGAVMAVPAHDTRDFAFARKYGLLIRQVIFPRDGASRNEVTGRWVAPAGLPVAELDAALVDPGVMFRSGPFDGLASEDATRVLGEHLEARRQGGRKVNYKFRDWLISRQRYWGCPIPIVHCDRCGAVPVPKDQLPVLLPEMTEFKPSGTGRSPLATVDSFVRTSCPRCGGAAERETDTMDGFACSSWYFLRFPDPGHGEGPFSPEAVRYWLPVDLYVGGAEHAVMHLLYARFWTKVMFDAGLIHFREPFQRLRNQGMLLGADGTKMSKSRGNVVTPDEVVQRYGADTVRAYLLFLGSFEQEVPWSDEAISGMYRFMHRVYDLMTRFPARADGDDRDVAPKVARELEFWIHKTVKKVTEDVESFSFNTGVAALMEFYNKLSSLSGDPSVVSSAAWARAQRTFLTLLAPIAPFLAEEMWERLGFTRHSPSVHREAWPGFDPAKLVTAEVEYPIQVNGKIRDKLVVPADLDEAGLKARVLASPKVMQWTEGKTVRNFIVVPGRLVSLVVK